MYEKTEEPTLMIYHKIMSLYKAHIYIYLNMYSLVPRPSVTEGLGTRLSVHKYFTYMTFHLYEQGWVPRCSDNGGENIQTHLPLYTMWSDASYVHMLWSDASYVHNVE